MGSSEQPPSHGSGARRAGRRRARLAGITVLGVVGLVFVVQNITGTEVGLLWWSLRLPLVTVLVALIALGAGLDRLWTRRRGRT